MLLKTNRVIEQPSILPKQPNSFKNDNFDLLNAYPNPFNNSTKIRFWTPSQGRVTVRIFNTAGQLIQTIENRQTKRGLNSIKWDAAGFSSGLYFYAVSIGQVHKYGKVVLIK
jgi:hypothetical protein